MYKPGVMVYKLRFTVYKPVVTVYKPGVTVDRQGTLSTNAGLSKPTPSHYVNTLIRHVAKLLPTGGHVEWCIPSQHTTGW